LCKVKKRNCTQVRDPMSGDWLTIWNNNQFGVGQSPPSENVHEKSRQRWLARVAL
jgi:hypothetical protein